MIMNKKNIYLSDIKITPDLDTYLKKCFLNHLVIYNYSLELLIKSPNIKLRDLKFKCHEFIKNKGIVEVISNPLFNELYYQYKKFKKKNIRTNKTLSGIQYITFLVSGYSNNCFVVKGNTILLNGIDGHIEVEKDLPELTKEDTALYFNISYSAQESKYQLSIFQ